MHRLLTFLTLTLTLTLPAIGTAQQAPAASPLPYVYTEWRQYTVADGLPNDHIFTVKADGHWIWIGTEGGLARLDKRSGKIRRWAEKDGLPWRVVSAIDVHPATGEVWLGLFGGGLSGLLGGHRLAPGIDIAVGAQPVVHLAPQQVIDRLPQRLADNVPAGHVDR